MFTRELNPGLPNTRQSNHYTAMINFLKYILYCLPNLTYYFLIMCLN